MNEYITLEFTHAGADAQPVMCDTVAVGKDVHLYLQVHRLTERKVGPAGR